jgi:hypothetical protein
MNDRDITNVLEQLVAPLDDEHGDWEQILEDAGETPRIEERRPSRWRPSRSRRVLLLLAAAVTVAALALTVAAPWRGGPSILDRAAAAIAAPTANQVLHESVVVHERVPCNLPKTPPTPSQLRHMRLCTVKGQGAVWLDGGPSQRFRVIFVGPDGHRDETGGSVGAARAFTYQPSDKVLDPVVLYHRISRSDLDPVAFARTALASGRARLGGSAMIRGQKVLRIRVTAHPFGREVTDALYFVDAHTYRPIQIVFTRGYKPDLCGLPLINLPAGGCSGTTLPSALIFDVVQYEHLAPTSENRKLADIRAQHPHAKIL